MIASCYTLDLYCDHPDHAVVNGPHAEYTDEYGRTCRADARRDGWRFNELTGRAICRRHRAGYTPAQLREFLESTGDGS